MKTSLLAAGVAVAMAMAAPAFADSIDFAQFGSDGTSVSDGATGTTNGGVGFTVTSPIGDGFTELQEGNDWIGQFAVGETILYDNGDPGLTTISFATTVNSVQDFEAQANLYGDYTATLTAYNALGVQIGQDSYDSFNGVGTNENTIPNLNIYATGISYLTIGTTNDGEGYALGGTGGMNNPPPVSGTPEPSTWALMILGVGGIGAAFRQAKKKHGFTFAKALSA